MRGIGIVGYFQRKRGMGLSGENADEVPKHSSKVTDETGIVES